MDDYINSKSAARKLAHTINKYWKNKGQPWVQAYVSTQDYSGSSKSIPNEIYVVRSNIQVRRDAKGDYRISKDDT